MIDPYLGVFLNGRYYNYESDSFHEAITLKNSTSMTQNSRTFNAQGGTLADMAVTLVLESSYMVRAGDSQVGLTVWRGVSRKDDLQKFICAQGNSMPLNLITPYGASYQVIPVGTVDYKIFNPDNPNAGLLGMEFRATLSFAVAS